MKDIEVEKIVGMWETLKEKEVEETNKAWENAFDQPYEKAGGTMEFHGLAPIQPPVYWEVSDTDVNTKYKSLFPRFLLEVVDYSPNLFSLLFKSNHRVMH